MCIRVSVLFLSGLSANVLTLLGYNVAKACITQEFNLVHQTVSPRKRVGSGGRDYKNWTVTEAWERGYWNRLHDFNDCHSGVEDPSLVPSLFFARGGEK